jgi:hypothetical protein
MQTESEIGGTPKWILFALIVIAFLLGACLMEMLALGHQFDRGIDFLSKSMDSVGKEVRLIGVDVENTNAIMIREGKAKPEDRQGNGPTQPKE